MKKVWISLGIALTLTFIGMYINYRSFQDDGRLKVAARMHGGEITVEHGFGLQAVHIYAMTPEESDAVSLRFSAFSFVTTAVLIFAAVYILLFLVNYFRKRT